MIPTPETGHVPFERVYEPAEDSYLLLDTLSSETEKDWLQARFGSSTSLSSNTTTQWSSGPSPLVAEIGTGSGVVLAFVNAHAEIIFGRSDILTIGIDVNSHACEATEETVRIASKSQAQLKGSYGYYLGNVVGDITTPLRIGVVDVLIFNPPYVPTPDLPALPACGYSQEKPTFEDDSHFLALSYAGGADGMETTNRLLDLLPEILSSKGVAYILLGAQNKPEAVKDRIRAWTGGWIAETVGSSGKKAGWEKLQIIRISRMSPVVGSSNPPVKLSQRNKN